MLWESTMQALWRTDATRGTPVLSLLQSKPSRGAPDHAASRTSPVITSAEASTWGDHASGLLAWWCGFLTLLLTSMLSSNRVVWHEAGQPSLWT